MSGLQRFEQRLESMISSVFARAFRSAVQPVEIAAALQRECDNNARCSPGSVGWCPTTSTSS